MKILLIILCVIVGFKGYSQMAGVFTKSPSGSVTPMDSIKFQGDTTISQVGWVAPLHDPHYNDLYLTGGNNNTLHIRVFKANWHPYSGNSAFPSNGVASAGFYPLNVMSESWYNDVSAFDSTLQQFQLEGLLPGHHYTVTISAANNGTGFPDSSVYRLIGPGATIYGPKRIYSGNNVNAGVTFTNVLCDINGILRYYISTDVISPGDHLGFFGGTIATQTD